MLFNKNIFSFAVVILQGLSIVKALQESFIDSGILTTEEAIRNTTNKLFSILKLKRNNQRLSQYIIINKHFASITLQDHDNLKEISKLTRTNTETNNETTVFMTAINELLNDDNHDIDENETKNEVITEKNDDNIVDIIETFLKRLRQAKELHDVNSYVNINENVLTLIKGAVRENTSEENQQDDYYLGMNSTFEDLDFWTPSGRRIFGGQRTKIKHFPFMASIQMFNNFQCAGSIIKSDLVITASSCLQLAWNNRFFRENPAFLSVRVGSSFYSGGGEVISVLEVYFHPAYEPKTLRNNICIVRLSRRIKFSWRARRRVRKIEIDRHASNLPFNTPGITILGWGAKGRSNVVRDPWSNILSYAVLDVYPLRECREIYSKEYVTQKNFCAGFMSKGGGACNRDIGGPGIDDGTLVGVVSFGSPICGAPDAPTVFTKLGYYADWIDEVMEQPVPYARKRTTRKPQRPRLERKDPLLTSTTFKIPPMPGGKMKPIRLNEVENALRMFDDNLFQDFMRTMFNSKEMAEYQDVFKEVKREMVNKMLDDEKQAEDVKQPVEGNKLLRQEKQLNNDDPSKATSPYEFDDETATKIIDFEANSEETATENDKDNSNKYTSKEVATDLKTGTVGDNLAEMIKKIDLKKIIEEETFAAKNEDANAASEPIILDNLGPAFQGENKNESVMTLLYLSEENKEKYKEAPESTKDGKGLSIATDNFHDITRTNDRNMNGTYSNFPENELYEILSEVIDDEMRNNEIRS